MKTFTIDTDNNISAFATPEEATASTTAPFESFSNQKELTALASKWPAERLIAIWNSLAGVEPVKSFKNARTAAGRIWNRIQNLGEPAKPKAKGRAEAAKGAPAKGKATKKATATKKSPKAAKGAKQAKVPG